MSKPVGDRRAQAIQTVIENTKRLIADARLLADKGSAASSLSLAILAFEEGGKGHLIELDLKQPGHVRSKHEFRHAVALMVLTASIQQKYGIDFSQASRILEDRIPQEDGKKRRQLPPIPDDLRSQLRAELIPQLQKLSDEQFARHAVEMNWLRKIVNLVQDGGLERLRQSGLYVDLNSDFSIASTPASIVRDQAEHWIWAAEKVLSLLERGNYDQAYTPLSELMTSAAEGDGRAKEMLAWVISQTPKDG